MVGRAAGSGRPPLTDLGRAGRLTIGDAPTSPGRGGRASRSGEGPSGEAGFSAAVLPSSAVSVGFVDFGTGGGLAAAAAPSVRLGAIGAGDTGGELALAGASPPPIISVTFVDSALISPSSGGKNQSAYLWVMRDVSRRERTI